MKILFCVLLCYIMTFGQGLQPGQFGTTTKQDTAYDAPYKVFVDAYFARVTTDGGIIVDSQYVRNSVVDAILTGSWDSTKFWVDAHFGIKVSNDSVYKMYDLRGHDLSQATAGKVPKRVANIINGKYVVRFDGGDAFATIDSIDFSTYKDLNIVAMVKGNNSISDDIVDIGGVYSADTSLCFTTNSTGALVCALGGNVGTSVAVDSNLGSSPVLLWGRGYKTMGGGESQVFMNGLRTMNTQANNNTDFFKKRIVYVGARTQSAAYFTGDISFVRIINGLFTPDQVDAISYLATATYGITLDSYKFVENHNVDSTNTGVSVAGDTIYSVEYPAWIGVRKKADYSVVRHIKVSDYFNYTQGIEYDSTSNCLYAAGESFDGVSWYAYKVTLAGALQDSIYLGLRDAGDFEIDRAANELWFRPKDDDSIRIYNLATKTMVRVIVLPFSSGEGIAIDRNYSNRFFTSYGSYISYLSYSGSVATIIKNYPYYPEYWAGDGAAATGAFVESYSYDAKNHWLYAQDDQQFHGSIPGGNRLWKFKIP